MTKQLEKGIDTISKAKAGNYKLEKSEKDFEDDLINLTQVIIEINNYELAGNISTITSVLKKGLEPFVKGLLDYTRMRYSNKDGYIVFVADLLPLYLKSQKEYGDKVVKEMFSKMGATK